MTPIETQVCDAYRAGHGVSDISRMFELRTIDVIGIVRTHNVQPPGMGVRRPQVSAPVSPDPVVLTPAAPLPRPEPAAMPSPVSSPVTAPASSRPTAAKPAARPALRPMLAAVADDADWDEEDADEGGRHHGRARGWLMPEEAVDALYARAGQRYQDVLLRARPAARPPMAPMPPRSGLILSRRAA